MDSEYLCEQKSKNIRVFYFYLMECTSKYQEWLVIKYENHCKISKFECKKNINL